MRESYSRMRLGNQINIETQEEDLSISNPQIICPQRSTPIKHWKQLAQPLFYRPSAKRGRYHPALAAIPVELLHFAWRSR
jgi:hypothetical protein